MFPALPIASALYDTWKTAQLGLRHWGGTSSRPRNGLPSNAMFYISACLGARAVLSPDGTQQEEGADSALLHRITFSDRTTSKTRAFDLRWFGRIVLLTILLTQAIATSILGIRRCLHDGAFTANDVRNMYLAFGRGWAEMVAIALTFLNRDWYFDGVARNAFSADRGQLFEMVFEGLYTVQSLNHPTIPQLRLAR
jgi:hypothetical protein